ncbi:Adenosine 3'-phospho 5'-phosphosulfate transporter 2 [Portunus trituberculatus]|uniref:Adenosine 3'-phospho 5'-phosphosulfate transporter 2 n=1 Tax=Portunus trituberculatus TaxID=210409 RepID=A0A5B7ERT8_PORTR|nr:Adenosine 3'-phospho 5'-phosphosulfate transporter 2 [Portunus trituberculatus]
MSQKESVSVSLGEAGPGPQLSKKVVRFFSLPVSEFPVPLQLTLLTSFVFIFYLMYGYVLELIFTLDGMQPYGWYLTLVQFAYYTLFALIQLLLSGEGISRKIPLRTYAAIAFLTVGTMGFSNSSVGYLNYPTQVCIATTISIYHNANLFLCIVIEMKLSKKCHFTFCYRIMFVSLSTVEPQNMNKSEHDFFFL